MDFVVRTNPKRESNELHSPSDATHDRVYLVLDIDDTYAELSLPRESLNKCKEIAAGNTENLDFRINERHHFSLCFNGKDGLVIEIIGRHKSLIHTVNDITYKKLFTQIVEIMNEKYT